MYGDGEGTSLSAIRELFGWLSVPASFYVNAMVMIPAGYDCFP